MITNALRGSKPGSVIRTIRLDDEKVKELLDRLDQAGSGTPTVDQSKPETQFYTYRTKIKVHVQDMGGTTTTAYQVSTRSVSAQSVRFLHGGFVHTGTPAMVQLTTPHGTWSDVAGRISECRYLEGNLHEVTLTFEHPLDPAVYAPEAVPTRVLLVEDDATLVRLAQLQLKQLRAVVDVAVNGQEALAMIPKKTYDVILMDMEMPVMDGFEAVRQLRSKGYSGLIVAVTGLTRPVDRDQCLQCGCDRYLPKPYTRENLATLLKTLHEEPLFSTFAGDPAMNDLIAAFVAELPGRVRQMEEAMRGNDVSRLAVLLRLLKSEGTGYGFDVISEKAAHIETTLLCSQKLELVRADMESLVKTCLQARSSNRR